MWGPSDATTTRCNHIITQHSPYLGWSYLEFLTSSITALLSLKASLGRGLIYQSASIWSPLIQWLSSLYFPISSTVWWYATSTCFILEVFDIPPWYWMHALLSPNSNNIGLLSIFVICDISFPPPDRKLWPFARCYIFCICGWYGNVSLLLADSCNGSSIQHHDIPMIDFRSFRLPA